MKQQEMAAERPVAPAGVIEQVRCWLSRMVIGQGLCPFAQAPFEAGRVRFVVSQADNEEALLAELLTELHTLRNTPMEEAETSLLIVPGMLADFLDYNDFLDLVDALLHEEGMEGEFQVASMHPDYRFAGTEAGEAQNYTNRSPWPILHVIREASLERALQGFPDPDAIPERNIRHMQELGVEAIEEILAPCRAGGKG